MPFNAAGVWWSDDKDTWWGRVGDLYITFGSRQNISEAAMHQYIEAMRASCRRDGAFLAGLTYLPLGGPSSTQRKVLGEVSAELGIDKGRRVALLTESAVARGALTAFSWIVRGANETNAWKPLEYHQAFVWLREHCTFDVQAAEELLFSMVNESGYGAMHLGARPDQTVSARR